MGYRKTSSETYAKAWEGYQMRCREEGFIALSQYCLSIGMKVQRLYEWLRRRKISLGDFHTELDSGRGIEEGRLSKVSFCEVEMSEPGDKPVDASVPVALEACFELRSGDRISLRGVSACDLAYLMRSLNAVGNVGS